MSPAKPEPQHEQSEVKSEGTCTWRCDVLMLCSNRNKQRSRRCPPFGLKHTHTRAYTPVPPRSSACAGQTQKGQSAGPGAQQAPSQAGEAAHMCIAVKAVSVELTEHSTTKQ
eukprot:453709-Pelagomonas_calceolata.AAC.2